MTRPCPYTPLSTPLSGSARQAEARIRNLFQGPKRRPPVWLMALTLLLIFSCGGLVTCRTAASPPPEEGAPVFSLTTPGEESVPFSDLLGFSGTAIHTVREDLSDWYEYQIRLPDGTSFSLADTSGLMYHLDLDGDGHPDLLAHDPDGGWLLVWRRWPDGSVRSQQLRQAFLSWTGVSDLIARIIESLYTSANTDEYYVMRYFLAKSLLNGYIGSVEIPEVGKDNAVDIATQFQYMSDLFQYQSTKYNMAGVTTHTDFEDQYFIVTAKFKATMNMNVLATAFNLEYREFQARMITVDTFTDFDWARMDALFTDPATGQLDPNYHRFTEEEIALLETVPAVLVSRDWWMVLDNYVESAQWFNGEGLYWNHWHHVWKTVSCSPFGQAAAFTPTAPSITSVTVTPAKATLSKGADLQLSAAVVGTGIVNQGVQWKVTGGAASGTAVTNGGYLHVAANETATTLTVTATSVQDGTMTGESTIAVSA